MIDYVHCNVERGQRVSALLNQFYNVNVGLISGKNGGCG